MSPKYTRREFLKISGLSVAGLALGGKALQALVEHPEWPEADMIPLVGPNTPGNVEITPTYCEICFWKCAGWVYKVDGKPWKIVGNKEDPNCYGRLCPRGTGGIGAYTDNERLKYPLMRKMVRGKQQFVRVSWEEALDFIASKMKAVAEQYGPESVALFTHGSGSKFFEPLVRAFGSDTIAEPSYAQCRGPREEGFRLTFGEGIGSPERIDIPNARCIVLIGSHLGENMLNSQVQEFSDAVGRGATIITVDPRFSTAASKSRYWLPIRPGTDLALLLAWINVLVTEELYDRQFVQQYTYGFDKLKQWIQPYTPEWAYPITTIKPDLIRRTAREMAMNKPATLIHPGRHVTWYGNDTQRERAMAILVALLGSWGRRGGYYYPNKARVPKYPLPPYPEPRWTWRDLLGDDYPLARKAPTNVLRDATLKGDDTPYPIKGWIVNATNLMMTLPEPQKTIEAIQKLDFIVAIDIIPSEITGWADVVLPECTYLERYDDLRISQGKSPTIALRAPAFEPRWESKPSWWMAKQLANRLGLEKWFPWKDIEEYLEYRLQKVGLTLAELKKKGVVHLPEQKLPIYFEEGIEPRFRTPTGKIELYSTVLEAAGFDPLPAYEHPEEPPEGYYRLIYGRAPMHSFSRTTNNPLLYELMKENEVWVHPTVAQLHGIKNGDYVVLENQDGARSNKIRVKVTERIRHDCVYMVHGFGHWDKRLKRAYKKGASTARLITKVKTDPIMGGTGLRTNFVTFRKVSELTA